MAFLKRSRSQRVKPTKDVGRETEAVPWSSVGGSTDAVKEERLHRFERRRSIFNRSKSANRAAEQNLELRSPGEAVQGETIEIREGGDTFNFPTPSPRLPPKSSTFEPSQSPLVRSHTTTHGGAGNNSPNAQAPPRWGRSFTSKQTSSEMSSPPPPPVRAHTTLSALPVLHDSTNKTPEVRKKRSGWKTLGGLFRSHAPKPTVQESFYQMREEPDPSRPSFQTRPLAERSLPSPPTVQSPASISSHHSRNISVTRGLARFEARAEADRAFMPSNVRQSSAALGRRSVLPPSKPNDFRNRDSEDMFTTMQQDRRETSMSFNSVDLPGITPQTPKLDLNIPNGDMERYSVMFEKLLEPRQSIMERRQSKQKRLRIVSKETSPNRAPTAVSHAIGGQRPTEVRILRRLKVQEQPAVVLLPKRSVTSPHLNKAPPQISVTKEDGKSATEATPAMHRPRPIMRSKTAPSGAISPVARNFSRPKTQNFESSESDTSPLDGEGSLPATPTSAITITDVHNHQKPLKPRHLAIEDAEPSWDMLTSRAATYNHSSDGMLREPYPRVTSPEDMERQIVQVSIARQVSVNRARKHVQKAVVSKQPLRPRVVELSRNRKSTFVVVEGGDD